MGPRGGKNEEVYCADSGTRAVRGLREPELYSLEGCVVDVVLQVRSGSHRTQCEIKAPEGVEAHEGP